VTLSTGITATRWVGAAKDSPLVSPSSTVIGLVGLSYGS
jgi:outer membrane scaffolding protein for murein synthesis (MipA/OmpV family)